MPAQTVAVPGKHPRSVQKRRAHGARVLQQLPPSRPDVTLDAPSTPKAAPHCDRALQPVADRPFPAVLFPRHDRDSSHSG
jgi:hypothetical protein